MHEIFGVKVAKYDWVCFLDADDIWEKDNLLMFSQEIFQFSELDVVGNLYKIIEPNGVSRTRKKNPLNYFDGRYKLNNFFDDFLFGDMPLNMSSFCLSKDVFNKIGGFNTDIRIGEDTLFLCTLQALKFILVIMLAQPIIGRQLIDQIMQMPLNWNYRF